MKAETIIYFGGFSLKTNFCRNKNPARKENQGNNPVLTRLKLQASRRNLGNNSKTRKKNLLAKNPRSEKTESQLTRL